MTEPTRPDEGDMVGPPEWAESHIIPPLNGALRSQVKALGEMVRSLEQRVANLEGRCDFLEVRCDHHDERFRLGGR